MKKRIALSLVLVMILSDCQSAAPPVTATPTSQPKPSATTTPVVAVTPVETGQLLSPFTIDWTKPFVETLLGMDGIFLTAWTPQPYAGTNIQLPLDLSQVINIQTLNGLTAEQRNFLTENGFVVIHSQEAQFGDIRVHTSEQTGQPYYLTTDAAFHALHLLFDELLKSLEREYFSAQMIAITKATLGQVRADLPEMQGISIETDARQALAYLSVALKLFDPSAEIDPSVATTVSEQVEQIMAADGRAFSALFPDFEDDYGAYKPVGHYAGDPDLEAYFRGMTWYGRMHFLLQDPTKPDFEPSRLPLIITLALRKAQLEDRSASEVWAELHRILTFVVGPSDDAGPLEYATLMAQVYGENPSMQALTDQARWQDFLSQSEQLPAPQINSLFVTSTVDLTPQKGWRFMGQRFTLDSFIFQNVIFDRVKDKPDQTRRELPSGLDVMAAFGSSPALHELEEQDVTSFPNYTDQLAKMQQAVVAQPEAQWLARFYDSWLYSLLPVLQTKDSTYPAYMQTSAWSYKDLNAALGSWAELKHDTILYTKMPEMAGGGGPPMSEPAPGYVEPNPQAFYRMAYMARTLSCGLQNLFLNDFCSSNGSGMGMGSTDAAGYIYGMGALGDRFESLGNIAAKELAGTPLDEDDKYAIAGCLGMIECMNTDTGYNQPGGEMPEVPIIAAVSGAQDQVLEVGIGNVDRIYAVVPLEDHWEIAQGGVFSYHEFSQPRAQRLTDEEWREKLAAGDVEMPVWASNFVLPGGQPDDAVFFRIGDIYIITKAGDNLNIRAEPSTSGAIITQIETGEYVEIVDGPVQADGYTWWKFKLSYLETTGWAVEDQEWYVRSYRPDQPLE